MIFWPAPCIFHTTDAKTFSFIFTTSVYIETLKLLLWQEVTEFLNIRDEKHWAASHGLAKLSQYTFICQRGNLTTAPLTESILDFWLETWSSWKMPFYHFKFFPLAGVFQTSGLNFNWNAHLKKMSCLQFRMERFPHPILLGARGKKAGKGNRVKSYTFI